MLGNDVVDLLDVDARPETFHRRFEARVFTPGERERIAAAARTDGSSTSGGADASEGANTSEAADALRWAHWAAKEAAYKLLRQRDPAFVFSPIRLEARFDAPALGGPLGATRRGRLTVQPGPLSGDAPARDLASQATTSGSAAPAPAIELASFETRDFVHVLALPAGADWRSVVTAVEPLASSCFAADEDASRAVRQLALRGIAEALGVDRSRLAIGRRGRIPTVELDGTPTPIALSLSHHGRFVAFAMVRPEAVVWTDASAGPEAAGRPAHGLRLVRREDSGRAAASERSAPDGARRDQTDDGHVAQAAGAVGCPARRANTDRKTG